MRIVSALASRRIIYFILCVLCFCVVFGVVVLKIMCLFLLICFYMFWLCVLDVVVGTLRVLLWWCGVLLLSSSRLVCIVVRVWFIVCWGWCMLGIFLWWWVGWVCWWCWWCRWGWWVLVLGCLWCCVCVCMCCVLWIWCVCGCVVVVVVWLCVCVGVVLCGCDVIVVYVVVELCGYLCEWWFKKNFGWWMCFLMFKLVVYICGFVVFLVWSYECWCLILELIMLCVLGGFILVVMF